MTSMDAAFWETCWREIVNSAPTRKREAKGTHRASQALERHGRRFRWPHRPQ